MLTKDIIRDKVAAFVAAKDTADAGKWRTPLVGFADAKDPGFDALKTLVDAGHELPRDVLPEATIVIACFVPLTERIVRGNTHPGLASPEWAEAYEETNALLTQLNAYLISLLESEGYQAGVSKEAAVFDREAILSRWSQRHIARLAGLGTFGLNNMLITQAGCCGRLTTVVTNLDVIPDDPVTGEYCLFKRDGSCGACARRCPTGALSAKGFDRRTCYDRCLENAAVHHQYGSSYASRVGEETADSGSEVCGKCLAGLPCSIKRPSKRET
jgi:epoxyqueuosine reductase QueG